MKCALEVIARGMGIRPLYHTFPLPQPSNPPSNISFEHTPKSSMASPSKETLSGSTKSWIKVVWADGFAADVRKSNSRLFKRFFSSNKFSARPSSSRARPGNENKVNCNSKRSRLVTQKEQIIIDTSFLCYYLFEFRKTTPGVFFVYFLHFCYLEKRKNS